MSILDRLLTDGRTLPKTGLLAWLKAPNSDNYLDDEGALIPEGTIDAGYALPTSCFAAVGVGPWFSDSTTSITRLMSEILADPSTNQYHVCASVSRGVTVHDPYATTDAILAKVHKYHKCTLDVRPTVLFNGVDFTGGTFTGGPTYVPDHLGVLRTPGADRPAVEGLRLEWVPSGVELFTSVTQRAGFEFDSFTASASGFSATTDGSSTCIAGFGISASVGSTVLISVSVLANLTQNTSFRALQERSGIDGTPVSISNLDYGQKDYSISYKITKTNPYITFGVSSTSVGSITVTNISVKELIPTYYDTTSTGTPIIPYTSVQTRTGNADFSAFTDGTTAKRYTISTPMLVPRWKCEPARTNYALQSATPATHTTGAVPAGTYCLWCEGGTSVTATAGTAIGTFGAATPGTPKTITITTAGTVVLTVAGVVTWVQLESRAFPTSRIYTTTGSFSRTGTVQSFPTLGKIRSNNMAFMLTCVPRASGQGLNYLLSSIVDGNNQFFISTYDDYFKAAFSVSGTWYQCTQYTSPTKDRPVDIIVVKSSTSGLLLTLREYTGSYSQWSVPATVDSAGAKGNLTPASTYQIGAGLSASQFTGNISELKCLPIPEGITDPLSWAKKEWGV